MEVTGLRSALGRSATILGVGDVSKRLGQRGCSDALRRADEVLQDTFSFSKTWDMERCETPFHLGTLYWEVSCNEDEEWCFMLNRMDYLDDLMMASLVTEDRRYCDKALGLMLSWTRAHRMIVDVPSTRTLDTGIRVLNMAQTLPYLVAMGQIGDDDLAELVGSLLLQMDSLRERYIPKYETSNWGSIQTLSTVTTCAMVLPDPRAYGTFNWAIERIESQLAAQVYPDGVDWEQSTMYHAEVLQYAMRALETLRAHALPLPSHLAASVSSMADALAGQVLPSGQIDAQGDSDRVDVRPLLALSGGVLQDACLKQVSGMGQLEGDYLYQFGVSTEDRLVSIDATMPSNGYFDGMDSGMFTARSDWGQSANMTLFSNGPMGSGHGHSDNLHLSMCYGGAPVLIDSGRYSYRPDVPQRAELKSAPAHNVPLIDGRSSSSPKGSWDYLDFSLPIKTYVRHVSPVHYWEGALVGHDPVQVLVRKVVFMEAGAWLVIDEAVADGHHELESLYHFDPSITLDGEGSTWGVCGTRPLTLAASGACELLRGQCSLEYNKLDDQEVLRVSRTFDGRGSLAVAMYPSEMGESSVPVFRGADDVVPDELAEAFRFSMSPDEAYTVVVFHREAFAGVKAFRCEGVSLHAQVALIHQHDGAKDLLVLRA